MASFLLQKSSPFHPIFQELFDFVLSFHSIFIPGAFLLLMGETKNEEEAKKPHIAKLPWRPWALPWGTVPVSAGAGSSWYPVSTEQVVTAGRERG